MEETTMEELLIILQSMFLLGHNYRWNYAERQKEGKKESWKFGRNSIRKWWAINYLPHIRIWVGCSADRCKWCGSKACSAGGWCKLTCNTMQLNINESATCLIEHPQSNGNKLWSQVPHLCMRECLINLKIVVTTLKIAAINMWISIKGA